MTTTTPRVVTLCGSSRFPDAFAIANMHLTLRGHIVIGLGMFGHADEPQGAQFLVADGDETNPAKRALDELHYRKIDLSDAIFVINVGGYVGSSTRREIAYAVKTGKTVDWLFPDDIPNDILEEMFPDMRVTLSPELTVRYIAIKYHSAANRYSSSGATYPTRDDATAVGTRLNWDRFFVGEVRNGELGAVWYGDLWSNVWRDIVLDEPTRVTIADQIGLELMAP